MHKAIRRSRASRRRALAAGCATGVLALAGCGEDEQFANEPSPPPPVTVTALVDAQSVSVSPARFGAGVVRIIIANQSDEPQTVGLRAEDEEEAPVTRTTDPIAVGGTGALKLDLEPGTYRLGTEGERIEDGLLKIGPRRPEGRSQLLLP